MKLAFDTDKYNSFYIHGPNGSKPLAFCNIVNMEASTQDFTVHVSLVVGGKSAIFAAFNLGLGGKAKTVDRGNRVSTYVKEGRT